LAKLSFPVAIQTLPLTVDGSGRVGTAGPFPVIAPWNHFSDSVQLRPIAS